MLRISSTLAHEIKRGETAVRRLQETLVDCLKKKKFILIKAVQTPKIKTIQV